MYEPDGRPRYLVGSIRDITEQHQMATELQRLREHERLQAIFDVAPTAVAIEQDGEVRYANPRFAETFGIQVGDRDALRYLTAADREAIRGRSSRLVDRS